MLQLSYRTLSTSRIAHRGLRSCKKLSGCPYTEKHIRNIATVQTLKSWSIDDFRLQAFTSGIPAVLPADISNLPSAIKKWFAHEQILGNDVRGDPSGVPQLNESFWSRYSDMIVPLEITRIEDASTNETSFDRIEGPLGLLLADLRLRDDRAAKQYSVYLAQHDLRDLPQDLQDDLPIPGLVHHAGKGDLYSSSLWLGKSPTYTPLHRDPNPNLLMQLAGVKRIRLFRPDVGDAIFDHAQQLVDLARHETSSHSASQSHSSKATGTRSASFRGEEMMKGTERRILHDLVWSVSSNDVKNEAVLKYAQDATLQRGQALFIPKGWWHSVKGVGDGVTASANWWFR